MVIVKVAVQNTPQVSAVEHNDMIQTLPTYRSNQTFDEGILPRAAGSRQDFFDSHAFNSVTEVVAIEPIAVTQQVARRCVPGKGLDHRLSCPESGGVRRDIEMHDTPTVVRYDKEDKQDTEIDRRDGEEIHRDQVTNVIGQKDAPALRGRFLSLWEQTRDGALGDLDTQFQQFAA